MSAQEGNIASFVVLFVAFVFGAVLLLSLMRPIFGVATKNTRIVLARARCAARSIGCVLPQPPTVANLVAVTIATLAITALLQGPILDLVVETVGTHQSPEQLAADAERSTWWTAGWASHIPGLTLISGVVTEEIPVAWTADRRSRSRTPILSQRLAEMGSTHDGHRTVDPSRLQLRHRAR
ncbi:hypothetical protein ACH4J9_33530, partial [Streptomyces albus]|uniref:hypothetical protein n=1 Tax=Streptomyces albus TaxID=1888 RepID=UPI00378FE368